MQRVRIGLTGLAIVFLLVLLAAVFTQASDEERITANVIEQHLGGNAAVAAEEAKPKEPLAELGVAPGSNAENNEGNTPPAAPSDGPANR